MPFIIGAFAKQEKTKGDRLSTFEFTESGDLLAHWMTENRSPEWIDIAQLGAIAVIRTFLNYFLEKDLETATRGAAEAVRLSAPRAS